MHIEAFVHGFAARKVREGAFAVTLTDGKNRLERHYRIAGHTGNQATLVGATFALLAIRNRHLADSITVYTDSHYLHEVTSKGPGGWLKTPKENQDLVEALRSLMQNVVIEKVKPSECEKMAAVREAARRHTA